MMESAPSTLKEAFDRFSSASASLVRTHETLLLQVARLEAELRAARSRLAEELAERRRTAAYLSGVLDSLACGVIVISPGDETSRRTVSAVNPAAIRILGEVREDHAGLTVGDLPEVVRKAIESMAGDGAPSRENAGCGNLMVEATASRILEPSGRHVGDVVVINDVTEIHRLEEVARRRSRLEAMGRLSAEIAHEIRNPLGSLDLTAGLLRDALNDQPEHRDLVDQILLGVQMLNAAVVKALSLTRPVRARRERVDAAVLTREVITYLVPVARSRQVRILDEVDAPAILEADRELFRQLALNLIQNGLEAAGPGGSVRVRLAPRRGRPLLTISDDGPGIAPEARAHIFEPLFTSKENGTGLGLAVVQRAAEEHGWRLRVCSAPGRGTTMTVELFARAQRGTRKGTKDVAIASCR